MKQRKTELVGKASADRYLKKAQEFLATAESELDDSTYFQCLSS